MNISHFEPDGKNVKEIINYADKLFHGSENEKLKARELYQSALEKVPNNQEGDKPYILRGIIRKRIWDCEKKLNKNQKFFSEAGQDKFIKDNFFKNQNNGFFIEIGAFDGIEGSNCHYFEKYESWEGVAIEASPKQFQKLERNRKCEKINAVIGPEEKEVEFCEITEGFTQMSGIYNSSYKDSMDRIQNKSYSKINIIKTKSTPFKKLISSDKIIDFISIDIEGNELDVINSIDFNKYEIKVILLENNIPQKLNYINFFKERNFSYFDRVGMDEIYFNKKYFNF